MTLLPKDYTSQENIISDCLSEFGLRYSQQYDFYPYTVDLFISELNMVIEADGAYGHFGKREAKRNKQLLDIPEIETVYHIEEKSIGDIKERLWEIIANE